jgi:hypothetical protein
MTDNTEIRELIARARRLDDIRAGIQAREAARCGGVAWSGLGPEPVRQRSPEAFVRCATAMRDALTAWRASRAGRLNAALARIQALARAVHTAAAETQASLARDPDGPCPAVRDLVADARALALAADAAMDAAGAAPLSGSRCATNTVSSSPSTGSPRSSEA